MKEEVEQKNENEINKSSSKSNLKEKEKEKEKENEKKAKTKEEEISKNKNNEPNKDKFMNQKIYYGPENLNQYYTQRHLHDHKMEKKDPLIDITEKDLQSEYINEVNYILTNLIMFIILSIMIYIQALLIHKNYKNYDALMLSQIYSAFTFFNSLFLIVELYRNALRDQYRYTLFRLFSIFFTIFSISLFASELWNTYSIYYKIQLRNEKCKENLRYCLGARVNKIILILSYICSIGLIIFLRFPIWFGYRSIRIIIGFDFEVFKKKKKGKEKEKKKEGKEKNNKNDKKDKDEKNKEKKGKDKGNDKNKNNKSKKNKKEHLKND
jgi:hypothetical protein